MAVIRPKKDQNTLHTPQTYPKVLQIPPTYIATSHMLYPFGLEIAQNHSKGPFRAFPDEKYSRYPAQRGPKHTPHASNIPKHAPDTTYVHCYQSHVALIWPGNRSKSLKSTLQQYMAHMAHFGPFRTSNIAVTRPSGGQNTLHTPQTYPNMLQIPPPYIATSHKLHLYGLEIAQNRSNPPYSTIWHYMAHFGPFQTSNMAVIRPSGGHNSLKMPRTYPKVLQIPPTCIATSHMLYPYGLEIAQNRPNGVKNRVAKGRIVRCSAICLYFRTSNRSRRVSSRSYIAILSESLS